MIARTLFMAVIIVTVTGCTLMLGCDDVILDSDRQLQKGETGAQPAQT